MAFRKKTLSRHSGALLADCHAVIRRLMIYDCLGEKIKFKLQTDMCTSDHWREDLE